MKRLAGKMLDHAFDLIPVLVLLAIAAGHAHELVITV